MIDTISAPDDRAPHELLTRRDLLGMTALAGIATMLPPVTARAQPAAEIPTSTRELWQWVRTQPVMDAQIAYLDCATLGPTWRASMANEYRARDTQSQELVALNGADRWTAETSRLATRFAAFIGCDPDEVAFTRGAGEALSMVAGGLDLAPGDEIVTTTMEHPAALSPWLYQARRRGVVVRQIPLPVPLTGPEQALALLTGAVTDRTRVLAFSHVQYADGAVLPVRELCQFARQRNLITVIDGAQAAGMLEFAVRDLGCDFYGASFHKWICGSHGGGLLYVRREMLDRIWPLEPRGIDAAPPVFTPTEAPGHRGAPAALHKLGNVVPYLWPSLRGAESAIDFLDRLGRSRIEARTRELSIYTRMRLQQLQGVELLTPSRPGSWAGILTWRLPGHAAREVAEYLARVQRVRIQALQLPDNTDGALRASLHIFNSHDDIERLVQGLRVAVGS